MNFIFGGIYLTENASFDCGRLIVLQHLIRFLAQHLNHKAPGPALYLAVYRKFCLFFNNAAQGLRFVRTSKIRNRKKTSDAFNENFSHGLHAGVYVHKSMALHLQSKFCFSSQRSIIYFLSFSKFLLFVLVMNF